MRVFVAGGSGELGRATIAALVASGHEVRATARGEAKMELVTRLGAEPVQVDLFDTGALRRAIHGSDAVLRLSTKIPPIRRMRRASNWEANNRLRTNGARALVDAVLSEGVGRYVSESVVFVYPDQGDEWIAEQTPVDPAGIRILEAALVSEREAGRVTAAGGAGIVLRFGAFYSPTSEQTRQFLDLGSRGMFPIAGPGRHYYSSIFVNDAGAAAAAALSVPAGIYNAVDDEPLRYEDYVRAVAAAAGGPEPGRVPELLGKAMLGRNMSAYLLRSLRVSNQKLRAASGWRPAFPSVREGLASFSDRALAGGAAP